MIAAMKVSDPELDTSIGSTTRKIFDVVAEQVAPAYAVAHLEEWVYSIENKSGSDLDDFCSMFGIYRLPAKRAIGVVTLVRSSVATESINIPQDVQISTGTTPQVLFSTV